MMSQPRLVRNDLREAVEAELDAAGFTYSEAIGGKHNRLLVPVNGREEAIILSGTPSDWRSVKNARAQVRRKIKNWKAEMEPQQMEIITPNSSLVYGGVEIGERGEMLSLTDMWRADKSPVNREPFNWIRKEGARLIDQVAADYNLPASQVKSVKQGKGGGTFAHWQIAMAYAQYLSTEFHVWCNSVVRCHMTGESIEETAPQVPTVAGDDMGALLELVSDLQSTLMAAVQRSDSHALDRVEDVKAALLHYMKVQLKEPSYAFFEDVRTRNKAAYDRDTMIIKEMRVLTSAINGLVKKAEQPLLQRPFVFADWYDCDRIYRDFFNGQTIPNRGFLSRSIGKSLDAYCKKRQRGFDMQSRLIGGRNVSLWHRDSVVNWMEITGHEMVRQHLAKVRKGDPVVLAFRGSK